MSYLPVAIKQSFPESGSSSFASSGISPKRKFEVLKGALGDDHSATRTILLVASSTPDESVSKALKENVMPVSSCSSESCEQSCSSSSNDSAQAFLEFPEESYVPSALMTPGLVTPGLTRSHDRRHRDERRTEKDDVKIDIHTNDSFPFSSDSHRRHSKIRDVLFSSSKDPYSNTWDECSWNLSVSSCFSDGRKRGTATIHTTTPTIPCSCLRRITPTKPYARPRGRKVESAVYAAIPAIFHTEEPIWEDTNGPLLTWSCARKKQKTMGGVTNVTKNDASCIDEGIFERLYRSKESIIKGCGLPSVIDSVEWRLWRRLHQRDDAKPQSYLPRTLMIPSRKVTLSKSQHHGNHRLSSIDSPYTLYRWLQIRLAAGLFRSSFDFLHRKLERYYKEAKEIICKLEQDSTQEDELASLFNLRDRIADIWCVYSHFSLEVGCLALAKKRKNASSKKANESMCCISPRSKEISDIGLKESLKTDFGVTDSGNEIKDTSCYQEESRQEMENRNIPNEESGIEFEDISNHAISILLKARDCPLVGSHTAIMISLVRLIVSATAMEKEESDCLGVELSRQVFSSKIQSAIDACWDNVDSCRSNSHKKRRFTIKDVSKKTIRVLSNFEGNCQKLQAEKEIVKAEVEKGIESTLFLPMDLRNTLSSTTLLSEAVIRRDKDVIRCLGIELNRLSRLGEVLAVNSHRAVRVTTSCDSELSFAAEELPLLAVVESLSDPLNHYEEVDTLGKGVIWHW
mmetsp:Transcript_7476/g.16094  ORF Transcript_7476/g.16094 Transcript_7476/m.16094 type:complete len:743 (-) Transcript_7476:156-2384(-)